MTADTSSTARLPLSFYASALSEADRVAFEEARNVTGLADEIALLRLHLRDALAARSDDMKLIERAMHLLVQSLVAQHCISRAEAEAVMNVGGTELEQLTKQVIEDMVNAPDD